MIENFEDRNKMKESINTLRWIVGLSIGLFITAVVVIVYNII